MPAYRFFTSELKQDKKTIYIKDKEHHHMKHVMKLKKGEHIELINGQGALGKAEILNMEKSQVELYVHSLVSHVPPKENFGLAQSFCQDKKKMAYIIEKACEMGCRHFWFFPSEKGGEESWYRQAEKKWTEVAISALKQSGNLFLPSMTFLPSLSALKDIDAVLLYGSLEPSAPELLSLLQEYKSPKIIFIIGPESGFSKKEELELCLFSQGVSLNPYTLRVETAANVAMGIISHFLMALPDRKR